MKKSTQAARGFARRCRLLFMLIFAAATVPGFSQIGWVQVPSISPGNSQNTIRGISGTSSSDIWAVGYFSNSTPAPEVFQDLMMHWNGSSWQQSAPLNLSTSLNDLLYVVKTKCTFCQRVFPVFKLVNKFLVF